MKLRLGRIALLFAAFTAAGTVALAQVGGASDTLPRHPIPYRALKKAAKPKVKPRPKPAIATPGSPPKTLIPLPSPRPAPNPPPPTVHPAPVQAAPIKAGPAQPAPLPLVVAPPHPVAVARPKPAPVFQPAIAPPPPLPTLQAGARLQPGQALPAPELEAFIDGQVSRAMASDHIAGVAVAVVQNGQLVMEKGYGASRRVTRGGIDPRSTLIRLGSGSQIFTWIAALKAVEARKLNLDAPVDDYLPDALKLPDEGFDKPILFRHLMSHTAGFEDRALGRRYTLDPQALIPLEDALRRFRPRRVRVAGLLSVQSDYGAALAGEIVAKVEGRPFEQVIEGDVLKPLALTHTSFREPYPAADGLPAPLNSSLASQIGTGFRWTDRGLEPQPFAYGQSLAPGLSASTTADDMARLMIALLDNGKMGEVSLYGPQAAALLRTPLQRPAPGMDGWAHGLAMQKLAGGFQALSNVGVAPAFRSNLSLIPGLNAGVFIVANTDTGAALTEGLPSAIVQRFYAGDTTAAPPPAAPNPDYAGDYLSANRAYHGLEAFADRLTKQSSLSVNAESGDLILSSKDGARVFAATSADNQFRSGDGAELLAPPSANGKAQTYVLGSGGGAATRIGGVRSRGVLEFWAEVTLLTVLATFAGLFIRDRIEPRETPQQIAANITQLVTCLIWCAAFAAFGLFAQRLSTNDLMFDWPNRWLVTASWLGLVAALLSVLMLTQLPGVWREERRIHGWSVWRKVRHTATMGVFLVFSGVLAAWGALEPWSS